MPPRPPQLAGARRPEAVWPPVPGRATSRAEEPMLNRRACVGAA
jgi:hypothetical protein